MTTLRDVHDRVIRLTAERLAHILEHPEMPGQEHLIAETLRTPDIIVLSHHDPAVRLYHRLFEKTPVTRKYLVVVVKYVEDAFVITAFFADKEKAGERLWPR